MIDYNNILERYKNNYVRDDQLDKFVALGVITAEQAAEIRAAKAAINQG